MAWDFSTDGEYAASPEWAREFVRKEIWPLHTKPVFARDPVS